MSETAVFSAMDERFTTQHAAQVKAVDGNKTSCAQAGCPFWVRVLPGRHVFSVYFTSDHSWSMTRSSYKYVDLEIEINDMRPRHVYVVRYKAEGDQITYTVEDMGENPDYGLTLGPEGVDQEYFPVEF